MGELLGRERLFPSGPWYATPSVVVLFHPVPPAVSAALFLLVLSSESRSNLHGCSLLSGTNNLNIEHECVWGVPEIPTSMCAAQPCASCRCVALCVRAARDCALPAPHVVHGSAWLGMGRCAGIDFGCSFVQEQGAGCNADEALVQAGQWQLD